MMSDALARRPWRSVDVPDDVLAVPTMLSVQELGLLYSLARDYARGDAAIVDAGCFLGGSSAALLAGLRDRPEPWRGPPVVSYDLFEVEQYTVEQYFSGEDALEVGQSFRPVYDRMVSGFSEPHVVREGDIVSLGWDGGPIEVLFIDVLKTWDVNDAVLRDFFPHVIPGRTVLVHQDYGWGEVPWIYITVELMRESLRWIESLPYGTHVFAVERPIPEHVLNTKVKDLPPDEKLALMDRAIANNVGEGRAMAEIAKGVLVGLLGKPLDGRRMIDDVVARTSFDLVEKCGTRASERLGRWSKNIQRG